MKKREGKEWFNYNRTLWHNNQEYVSIKDDKHEHFICPILAVFAVYVGRFSYDGYVWRGVFADYTCGRVAFN